MEQCGESYSVPQWLCAMCWNGHREAHATSAQKRATMVHSCILLIIYVYAVWMGGAGGFRDGIFQVLVSHSSTEPV